MAHSLQIHLFGAFNVLIDGQPLTNRDWRSQQTRAVFKLLLIRRGKVLSSERIIETLWENDPPDAVRRRLHVRISQLRAALGEHKSLLQTVDQGYLFRPDETCWLDVDAFQTAAAEGRRLQGAEQYAQAALAYEQARALYRGDFLAEDLYTDWTFSDREFYRERFLTALLELSECYARQGRYRLAIARAQDALARDPGRETVYVRLMLYHYFAGERAQSLRVYEQCRRTLAEELALEPLPATVEVAEKIRTGRLWDSAEVPRYPPPIYEGRLFEVPYALSEVPLVGREREYAWLVKQWQAPERRVILLEGEAGIGKSRLAGEFTGYLASQGVSVLQIKIAPGEPSPLGRIVSALQPLIRPAALAELPPATLGVLAPLFPSIGQMMENLPAPPRLDPAGERQRLYAALTDLAAACLPGEALLWIDDAHRLGRVACEMLTGMTGRLKLLLSYRSEEAPPDHPLRQVFRATQREGAPAVLRLHALRPADVEALIRQLSHRDLAEVAAEINRQAEGNPLHVVSLLQHLFDEGQLYVDAGGGWGMTGEAAVPLPATIREAIQSRLQRLTPVQRRVLDMAAVLGGAFDFAVLQAASPQPEASLLTVLDELMDAALITEPRRLGQPEFAIAHDRYTEISYETLPGVRRRQLHAQAGRALEQVHAGDLQPHYPALATHFGKAEIPEKERRYAALAGEQAAARFANAEAIRYLKRALELTAPDDAAPRARLLLRCEQVYDLLGEREAQREALEELTTLEARLSPQVRAEVLHRKARLAWLSDDTPQAQIHIGESIRLAQTCGAVEVEAAGYLLNGKMTLDQDAARQLLGKARLLAQQAGLRGMEGDIVRSLGNACFWQNDYETSQSYFERALTIHREVGDLRGELSACNNLGLLRQTRGDFPQARDFFGQGLAICEKTGDRLAEGVLLTNLGEMTAALGEYRQAQAYLERACRIREEVGNEEGVAMVLQRLGDVLTRQGAYTPAMRHYARALEINTRIEQHRQRGETLAAMGMLRYELGDYAGAQEAYRQSLAVLPPEAEPHRAMALAGLSLLYHALGDDAAAITAGEQALSLPVCESLPALRASVLTPLGHALSGAGRPAEAAGRYRQALEIRRRLQQPHLETEPLAGLAALAVDGGNLDDAMTLVKPVLARLEAGPLHGPAHPTRVYLTCYRVLQAAGDPRAGEVLAAAHALLQERAAAIQDASLRRSYLENVAANREVARLFERE